MKSLRQAAPESQSQQHLQRVRMNLSREVASTGYFLTFYGPKHCNKIVFLCIIERQFFETLNSKTIQNFVLAFD